jgi:hypothetical protein
MFSFREIVIQEAYWRSLYMWKKWSDLPWPWGLRAFHPNGSGSPCAMQPGWNIFTGVVLLLFRVVFFVGGLGVIDENCIGSAGILRADRSIVIIAIDLRRGSLTA